MDLFTENTCSSGKFLLAGRYGKKLFVLGRVLLLGEREFKVSELGI